MIPSNHNRSNPGMYLLPVYPAGTKQFHGGPKLFCILKIYICNSCNSFRVDILIINLFAGCHCCQNRNLAAGIVSLNISLRIAFRIAHVLSFL